MENDEELKKIADSFVQELEEKYPRFSFIRLKLQAPGYAVACTRHSEPVASHLFMVKFTRDKVLFDTENRRDLPDFFENCEEGMLLRKLEIDYSDPRMMDLIFEFAEKWMKPL